MLGSLAGIAAGRVCCTDDTGAPCVGVAGTHLEIRESDCPLTSSGDELLVNAKFMRGVLPRGPKERAVPTYSTTRSVKLEGKPLYSGTILQLKLGESINETTLNLHANGFSLTPTKFVDEGVWPVCHPWSPFSLVEKCQVKGMQQSALWAVLKLTVFRTKEADCFLYFATSGRAAYEDRDAWVEKISQALCQVTTSLFPDHAIAVQPVPWEPVTCTRIMAGYLLQSTDFDNVALIYCELHAYSGGEAHLSVYKDEWCDQEVMSISLSENSVVSTRNGEYCTVFGVDDHRFCARSQDEKDLWLRAVSNIKVKLMFDAPDPTHDDLQIFRDAVREKLDSLGSSAVLGQPVSSVQPSLPLLEQATRIPDVDCPPGDVLNPEPIDDAVECAAQHNFIEKDSAFNHDWKGHTGRGECKALAEEQLPLECRATFDQAVDMLLPEECRELVNRLDQLLPAKEGTSQSQADSEILVPANEPSAVTTVHVTETAVAGNHFSRVADQAGAPMGHVLRNSPSKEAWPVGPAGPRKKGRQHLL